MDEPASQTEPLNFDAQVLQSELSVLVDYWAEWCASCKAVASVLDEVAEEYRARLRVVKVNLEQRSQLRSIVAPRTSRVNYFSA